MKSIQRNNLRKLALAAGACAYTFATLAAAAPGPIADVPLATQGGLPPNMMIMLDSSGSMRDPVDPESPRPTRLESVQEAAKDLIDNLPDKRIRVGLSSFDGERGARVRHNLATLDSAEKKQSRIRLMASPQAAGPPSLRPCRILAVTSATVTPAI